MDEFIKAANKCWKEINMAEDKGGTLVAFESGHYKTIRGTWKGDSVWCHFNKERGGTVHINKDKVEYIETFGEVKDGGSTP
jgi:hypothetical protein